MIAQEQPDGSVVPRVERRHWNGPNGYFTTHWVVVTAAGVMLNAKGRNKKFRSIATANAALDRVLKR